MFVKKNALEIYSLGKAQFKFRKNSDSEIKKFKFHIDVEIVRSNDNLYAEYCLNPDDCYAAFLLKDFSGVEDENGKPCHIARFDFEEKIGLIKGIKQLDSSFSEWFKALCEPPEKKIAEVAAGGEVVDGGNVPAVQGQ